jgi:hypothetical protein
MHCPGATGDRPEPEKGRQFSMPESRDVVAAVLAVRDAMRRIILLLSGLLIAQGWLWGGVRRVRVPQYGVSPDVIVTPSGEVYLVFARNQNAYLAISKDNGNTFFDPVQLNRVPRSVMGGHERGPKIALGGGETAHIVWMSARGDQLLYTRARPDASDFSPPRNLLDAKTRVDGATVAADQQGNVFVAWLDARQPKDRLNPLSLPVFWTESQDAGQTFSKNQTSTALRACSGCALKAMAGPEGGFDLAFRGAYDNIHDMFLARFTASENGLLPAIGKIHDDHWALNACPMSGPSLARSTQPAAVWAAWMSRGRAYFAERPDEGQQFQAPRTPRARRSASQNHPLILLNSQDQVLLAWEEGATIRWQLADPAGEILQSGNAGTLPQGSKAAGYVDREGNFCLVF